MSEEQNFNAESDRENTHPTASFAPADPTDGRPAGSWKTRYDPASHKLIYREAYYVGALFIIIPALIILLNADFFSSICISFSTKKYCYAWLGGMLGGTLFSTKWLYHSVAKDLWNEDRFLWRIFTPHISGALSFSFIILISSGIISLFSPTAINKNSAVFGLGFLIGYFSDSAIAKLTEVANTIFGATQKDSSKNNEGNS